MSGVRRLRAGDLDKAAAVLARSHQEDPAFAHVLPDPEKRARVLPWIFRQWCDDALAHGRVLGVEDGGRLAGAAAWYPPEGFPLTVRRKIRGTVQYAPLFRIAPGRIPALFSMMTEEERQRPAEPAWYLAVIGVDDGLRGAGVGGRLIEPLLEEADRDCSPCFLETAKERNVRWYERMGFRVMRAGVALVKGGPTHWLMWREPGGERNGRARSD